MCKTPELANRRVLTALPHDVNTENFVFSPWKHHQLRVEAHCLCPSVLKTKKPWVRNISTFQDKSLWWCTEPRKQMVSCFSAPNPPIYRGLGWAPNKTIFPLPGTHLGLYCEQRSAAAGTDRSDTEIILSAISYKYLTEKGERERWGVRKRQEGIQAGAVRVAGVSQGTSESLVTTVPWGFSNKLKVRPNWGFASLFEAGTD